MVKHIVPTIILPQDINEWGMAKTTSRIVVAHLPNLEYIRGLAKLVCELKQLHAISGWGCVKHIKEIVLSEDITLTSPV